MPKTELFRAEQFVGSFHIYATMWMLKAFVEKQATDTNVTYAFAAREIVETWAEKQLESYENELRGMTAGEFRLMKIQHKLSDTDDLTLEFKRVLHNAKAQIYKMLHVEFPEKEEKTPGGIVNG
jgi:hypothetical protein